MQKAKRIISIIFLAVIMAGSAQAQCAMCRANAESNIKSGKNDIGKGLNRGILYLLSIPYLLGGAAAVIYFKNRGKAQQS
jgi:hypothetical protein